MTGKQGYLDFRSDPFTLRLHYKEEYDVATNSHVVSIEKAQLACSNHYGVNYRPKGTGVSIGGKRVASMSTGAEFYWRPAALNAFTDILVYMGGKELPWKGDTIIGKDDGSCATTVAVELTMYSDSAGVGEGTKISGTVTLELTTLPRASAVTVPVSAPMGKPLAISIAPAVASFRHRISYSFAGGTGVIAENAATSAEWNVPIDLAGRIPTESSGVATITCQTYNGDTMVGESFAYVTLTVPKNSDTLPTATVEATPENGLASAFAGLFIQKKTAIRVKVTASVKYSTVKSIATNGVAGADAVIPAPDTSGNVTLKTTVTDARGFATTVDTTISVIAYGAPAVVPYSGESKPVVARCDIDGNLSATGECLRILAGRSYSKVISGGAQKNYCSLKWRYRTAGGSYTTWREIIGRTASSDLANITVTDVVFSKLLAFEVQIAASDDITGDVYYTAPVPIAEVPLHLGEGGLNLGLGMYCNYAGQRRIDAGWPMFMNGNRLTGLPTPSESSDALTLGYANGNFAKAGYGLGTVQPIEWGNIDNITANGWYSAIVNGEITSGATAYMVWIRVDGLDTNYACQTAYITGADCVLERHKQAGVWGKWEFKNPPMVLGVEYRTAERNEGKAVYVARVSVGTMVANGEVQIPIKAGTALNILRFSGQLVSNPLPNTLYGAWVDVQAVNASTMLIRMHTDEPALVGSPVYVSIWYTKD